MILRRTIAGLSAVLLLLTLFAASGSDLAGTAQDPIATLQYVQTVFLPNVNTYLTEKVGALVKEKTASAQLVWEALQSASNAPDRDRIQRAVLYQTWMKLLDSGFYQEANKLSARTVKAGERLVVAPYSSFTVLDGKAFISGDAQAKLVNATSGKPVDVNGYASLSSLYVVPEERVVAVFPVAGEITVLVEGKYQIVPKYEQQYLDQAFALKSIGLFKGSNQGFELEREATRLEALILFLRLIGEERQALAYTGKHPFADVPVWPGDAANRYVAYAYNKGYTKGISNNRFGAALSVTGEQYMTFVLRALGYKDGADFSWAASLEKGTELRILLPGDKERILRRGFNRDLAVYISYYSLGATVKNSSSALLMLLVEKGQITQTQAAGLSNSVFRS